MRGGGQKLLVRASVVRSVVLKSQGAENWPRGGLARARTFFYRRFEQPRGLLWLWWCLGMPTWRRRPARGLVRPGDAPRRPARRGRAWGASGRRLEHRRTTGERGAGRSMSHWQNPSSAALPHANATRDTARRRRVNAPTTPLILLLFAAGSAKGVLNSIVDPRCDRTRLRIRT